MAGVTPPAILLSRSRGAALEAEHLGGIAVMDADGRVVFEYGQVDRPFFPRSAIKLFHALPFLAGGAAAGFGCSRAEIVLAASSQSGEEESRFALAAWQKRLNLPDSALHCGAEAPLSMRERARLAQRGENPTILHNNNAGKHLAALTDALHRKEDVSGYCAADHPVQKRMMAAIHTCCDWAGEPALHAVDQCGMVASALPLRALALGMARLAHGRNLPPEWAQAAADLRAAIQAVPDHLAGSGRIVTQIIRLSAGRIIAKGGSEGVFTAFDQRTRQGFAVKVHDGSSEAASAVMVELLAAFHAFTPKALAALRAKANPWAQPGREAREQALHFPFLESISAPIGMGTRAAAPGSAEFHIHKTRHASIEHKGMAADKLDVVAQKLDHALEEVSALLNLPIPRDVVVRILPKPHRSRMQGETRRILLSRFNLPDKAALIHEVTHVLLGESRIQHPRFGTVLTEGIAVYLQSRLGGAEDRSFPTNGADVHDLLRQLPRIPPLIMDFAVEADAEEDMAARRGAYLAAGSFVRHLVETMGMEAFLALYHPAPEERPAIHTLLEQKESEWRAFLGFN
jgi:L-asparaginase II